MRGFRCVSPSDAACLPHRTEVDDDEAHRSRHARRRYDIHDGNDRSRSRHAGAAQPLGIYIGTPPPVRYHYTPPAPADYVWAPGYWRWDRGRQVWIDGRWVKPRHGPRWAPGHWKRGRGWWDD
jgi:hypothetical protein